MSGSCRVKSTRGSSPFSAVQLEQAQRALDRRNQQDDRYDELLNRFEPRFSHGGRSWPSRRAASSSRWGNRTSPKEVLHLTAAASRLFGGQRLSSRRGR